MEKELTGKKKKKKVENKRIMRLKKCMGQIKKKKECRRGEKIAFLKINRKNVTCGKKPNV